MVTGGLNPETAEHMVENAIGVFGLPLGVARNFIINGVDVLVPMVVEEPSVIAGASFMAKIARAGGGFKAEVDPPEMIGQLQVLEIPDIGKARQQILEHQQEILDLAGSVDPVLTRLGGGPRDLEVRIV